TPAPEPVSRIGDLLNATRPSAATVPDIPPAQPAAQVRPIESPVPAAFVSEPVDPVEEPALIKDTPAPAFDPQQARTDRLNALRSGQLSPSSPINAAAASPVINPDADSQRVQPA